MNFEATLDQRLDHRAVRNFDRGQDLAGLRGPARRHQPGGHLGQALATMFEDFLACLPACLVHQEYAVALASPVNAGVPLFSFAHGYPPRSRSSRRNLRRSLYWRSKRECASGADSPRGVDRGQSIGARVHPRCSRHRVITVAPDGLARFGKATPFRAVARRSHYVSLRFTSRDRRRPFPEPFERVQGGVSSESETSKFR